MAPNGKVKVDRVVCAVDCGTPINPDVITAQMEGGIGFGLGAALYGAITLKDGQVEQTNFDAYQVLRIDEIRRSKCISCRRPKLRPVSANRVSRRSDRPSPTRSSPRPANGCAFFRSQSAVRFRTRRSRARRSARSLPA